MKCPAVSFQTPTLAHPLWELGKIVVGKGFGRRLPR